MHQHKSVDEIRDPTGNRWFEQIIYSFYSFIATLHPTDGTYIVSVFYYVDVGHKWTCAYIECFKFDYTDGQSLILILLD